MRNLLLIFLVALFITPKASNAKDIVATEDMTQVVRVFSQVIETQLPKGWKPAFRDSKPTHFMMEYLPENETLKEWNTMFTLQGFKGLAGKATLNNILGQMAMVYLQTCGKENMVASALEEHRISGHKAKSMILGCAKMPKDHPSGLKKGMGEIAYFIAVEGKDDLYLFHKAKRRKAFDPKKPPITEENAKDFISDFMPIKLINP